jgi:RNA polymerase sigma-70 factor, ECF subfamily
LQDLTPLLSPRQLRAWDLFHFPPLARAKRRAAFAIPSKRPRANGAGVERATASPAEAYARFGDPEAGLRTSSSSNSAGRLLNRCDHSSDVRGSLPRRPRRRCALGAGRDCGDRWQLRPGSPAPGRAAAPTRMDETFCGLPDTSLVMEPRSEGVEDSVRFERLYREHAPRVIAYVARRLPDDVVHDVVAETFAVAWRRFDRVPTEPLPWLLGVARRVAANQRRSLRRRIALAERAAGQARANVPQEVSSPVLEALASLAESDREAVLLAAWDGLSAAEAASVLGCSPTAYRIRLHRARRKLAARLDRRSAKSGGQRCPVLRPEELP